MLPRNKYQLSVFLACIALNISIVNCISDSGDSTNNESCFSRNFIIVATVDGMITALDINTGQKCWELLLDPEKFVSSSLSELKIYENGRRIFIVPSLDGFLFKYDRLKRVIQPLSVDVDSLISHSVYLDSSTNIIGGKIKVLHGLNRVTGEVVYTCTNKECITFKTPIPENIIIVEEIVQFVNAIDSSKAITKWSFRVVELKIRLGSHVFNENSSPLNNITQKNALIPHNYDLPYDFHKYKVSLQNGYAGMINSTSQDFFWQFKASYPINDAWYLKEDKIKIIDPFDKESGFFSIDMDDGKYSALLFLGSYQSQLFIKKSKKLPLRSMTFSALSKNVLFQTYSAPVCTQSENKVSVPTPSIESYWKENNYEFNVTDYGLYFYMNFSITENSTHCIIQTSYVVENEYTISIGHWLSFVLIISCILAGTWLYVHYRLVAEKNDSNNARTCFIAVPSKSDTNLEFKSRFHQDFEMISLLGKGGFGIVMDVKNKIDDCHYAVKRICLHEELNNVRYERVLREVKALAKLDHHGIVRYFNAWIEYPPAGWQETKDNELNIGCFSVEPSSEDTVENTVKASVPSQPDFHKKFNLNPLQPFIGTSFDLLNEDFSTGQNSFAEDSNNTSGSSIEGINFDGYHSENSYQIPTQEFNDEDDDSFIQFEEASTDKNPSEKVSDKKYSCYDDDDDDTNSTSVVFKHTNKFPSESSDNKESHSTNSETLCPAKNVSSKKIGIDILSSNEKKHTECKTEKADLPKTNLLNKYAQRSKEKLMKKLPRGYLYIQMQLCQKESLRDWLIQNSVEREYNKVMEIFSEIVDAVHYVHNCGLMHRDLKPSNIFFSLEGAIKIGDFGLATSSEIQAENISNKQQLSFTHTSGIGTAFYMSPEQKLKREYDCKTDIYSLGIILFELLVPFKTASERFKVLTKVKQFQFPEKFKKNFKKESDFVQQLLDDDPKCRPTTDEIMEHPLLLKYITHSK